MKRARGQANADDSRQEFNHPPSSHHPSLPAPFSNGANETGKTRNTVGDWVTGELEGPGMPVARPFVNSGAPSVVPDVDTDGGAVNGEGDADIDDGRTYCYCERVSFGEMIACDDSNCEREWVSYPPMSSGRLLTLLCSSILLVSASLLHLKARGYATRARRAGMLNEVVEEANDAPEEDALARGTRHNVSLYSCAIICCAFSRST